MDYKQGRKFSEAALDCCQQLLKKENLNKEDKMLLISSAETHVFLLTKIAGGMHLARAHWLAARCFYKIKEGNLAFFHAQFCEFITKSSSDRSLLDEAYSLDMLGRSLQLKGQASEGQKCLDDAIRIVDKIDDATIVRSFKEYLAEVS